MLDILTMVLLSRSLGTKAETKGHPRVKTQRFTVLACLGGEILGAVAGYAAGGEGPMVLGAFVGLGIGAFISSARVDSLPRREPDPLPLGERLMGERCPQCEQIFKKASDVVACATCGGGFHEGCVDAHRAATHAHKKKKKKPRHVEPA